MGLFKAFGRVGAKLVSRVIEKREINSASSKAYEQTGKEIARAKKKGQFINGSYRFKSNKYKNIQNARRKGNDRETFINDLF